MSGTLVDTNVLLDVATNNPVWGERSLHALESAAIRGALLINGVVFAELSVGYVKLEDVERVVAEIGLSLVDMPSAALFLAGKAFRRYREAGGPRTGVLPRFFIGAHAAAAGLPLLTRDLARYRTYFPTITLIAP